MCLKINFKTDFFKINFKYKKIVNKILNNNELKSLYLLLIFYCLI